MLGSVLSTKLHIPRSRGKLVERPRLFILLVDGLRSRLITVTGPAGYGKSTLVSEWTRIQTYPTAWLSLNESDSDVGQFLSHFIAAIQTVYPHIGQDVQVAITGGTIPSMENVFSALINELVEVEDFIFVLDDYHLIESTEIDNGISFFVMHLPETFHLVVISRIKPDFPLARLRARNELTEVTASDLSFLVDEVQQFLIDAMGIALDSNYIASILQRTEGWAAGLQLAALALKRADNIRAFVDSFTGSHRYVMDYLTDEVLVQLSQSNRDFLLQTSILSEMCGDLANAVTGGEDSQDIIERLEKMSLFVIPLDEERRWYRYHHLFATLLQHRLSQSPQHDIESLHQRAGNWYADQEIVDSAIGHFSEIHDVDSIVKLVEQHGENLIQSGNVNQLQGWLNHIPLAIQEANYKLCILQIWICYFAQQPVQAAGWVNNADHALADNPLPVSEQQLKAAGMILSLRSWIAFHNGDSQSAIVLAQEALGLLPEDAVGEKGMAYGYLADALLSTDNVSGAIAMYDESCQHNAQSGNWVAMISMAGMVAYLKYIQGKLQQAESGLSDVINQLTELGRIKSTATARMFRTFLWNEQNRLQAVADELPIIQQLVQYESTRLTVPFDMAIARYRSASGDVEGAEEALNRCEAKVLTWTMRFDRMRFLARINRLRLRMEDIHKPFVWLDSAAIKRDPLTITRMEAYLAKVDILRATNTLDNRVEALEFIQDLHALCYATDTKGFQIDVYCLESLIIAEQEDVTQALTPLRQALFMGEEQGFVRTFIDYGQPMARLLYEASVRKIHREYAGFLLTQFPEIPEPRAKPHPDLIEPLTDRELEILYLLATGLSNQEIANQLFLAVNTVKVHNRKIYTKLNTKNRTEAVARARQLGVID